MSEMRKTHCGHHIYNRYRSLFEACSVVFGEKPIVQKLIAQSKRTRDGFHVGDVAIVTHEGSELGKEVVVVDSAPTIKCKQKGVVGFSYIKTETLRLKSDPSPLTKVTPDAKIDVMASKKMDVDD